MEKRNNSTNLYTPGICNIGKEEISKRKKLLAVAALAVIVFTFFCFDHEDSLWMKVFLFLSSSVFVSIYIEVRQKFCITLGIAGYFNFGKGGKTIKIRDVSFRTKDKKKALKIVLQSLILALLFTLFVALLSKLTG